MILSDKCWLKSTCKKYKNNECAENSFCIKLFKLNALYENALMTDFQRKKKSLWIDEDCSDERAFTELSKIENNIEDEVNNGINIHIHSAVCGNGKTSWALRLIQAYFNAIWHKTDIQCKALFINVPRFLLALKDNISEKNEYVSHIKANVLDANLVVWDDIATKSITTFEAENLLSIIDARMNAGKANIFTSNMTVNELYEQLGQRLGSRIVGLSKDIELVGQDKRCLNKEVNK